MKIVFVALAALVLGAAGGFAVGMSRRPNAEPAEAKAEKPAVSEDAARLAKAIANWDNNPIVKSRIIDYFK